MGGKGERNTVRMPKFASDPVAETRMIIYYEKEREGDQVKEVLRPLRNAYESRPFFFFFKVIN